MSARVTESPHFAIWRRSAMRAFRCQQKAIRLRAGVVATLLLCSLAALAEARVGGGRSLGSRGSRSFSAPVRPSTPSPGNAFGQRPADPSSPYAQSQQGPFSRPSPFPQTSPYGGGGFWRSVGGGLLGGFLGGMLFRSLGFGGSGGYGYGGGWGGPGLFDLLLLGLIGYVAYRFLTKDSDRREYADGEWPHGSRGSARYEVPETAGPPARRQDSAQGI